MLGYGFCQPLYQKEKGEIREDSPLTSLHNIMDCMTYVYCRSWLCDKRAPPIPMVMPSR